MILKLFKYDFMNIGKKLMQVDYERLETPEFLNLKKKAEQYASSGGYKIFG